MTSPSGTRFPTSLTSSERRFAVSTWTVVTVCCTSWACSGYDSQPRLSLPTAPTTVTEPPPAPPPRPVPLPPVEFTAIEVGEVVTRTIGSNPPRCYDFPESTCQYFEFTAPRTGELEAIVNWAVATQGGQPIDISLRGPFEVWAQTYLPGSPRSEGRLTATVTAGERYRIVLWYTFANLEYELRTALQ